MSNNMNTYHADTIVVSGGVMGRGTEVARGSNSWGLGERAYPVYRSYEAVQPQPESEPNAETVGQAGRIADMHEVQPPLSVMEEV